MEQHLGAQTLAAGRAHSLYVDTNGYLWAWGANNAAQLGDVIKDQSNRLRPLRVGLETNWGKVYADGDSSFAIKKDGSLWACGDGQMGQLGDGTRMNRVTTHWLRFLSLRQIPKIVPQEPSSRKCRHLVPA